MGYFWGVIAVIVIVVINRVSIGAEMERFRNDLAEAFKGILEREDRLLARKDKSAEIIELEEKILEILKKPAVVKKKK